MDFAQLVGQSKQPFFARYLLLAPQQPVSVAEHLAHKAKHRLDRLAPVVIPLLLLGFIEALPCLLQELMVLSYPDAAMFGGRLGQALASQGAVLAGVDGSVVVRLLPVIAMTRLPPV